MDKIPFKIIQTETEFPKETIEAYIGLHDEFVEYKVDYYLDEKDEVLGMQIDKYVFFRQFASKEAVMGVFISYKHKSDRWCVNIHVMGFSEDIWVYFKEEEKAKSLFGKIMLWKYGVKSE